MKTKCLTFRLLTLLILGMTALTSCSKDDDIQPEETFDINNLAGYFLYYESSNFNSIYPYRRIYLLEFTSGKICKRYSVFGEDFYPYTIEEGNIINTGFTQFLLDGDSILDINNKYKEINLIKVPESNQLAGKIFGGTYYLANMSVLHPNFFYSFAAEGYKLDAGFIIGTTQRIQNYTPIGNVAARSELDNGDTEFMVLVNGKLEVNYKVKDVGGNHYGTFEEQ